MTTQWSSIIDHQIDTYHANVAHYPMLQRAATPIMKPTAPILGRDMSDFRLALRNPEKANVILLGDPGTGKTAFVQGFAYNENSTAYLVLAVDVERLVKDSEGDKDVEMSNGLMDLVAETRDYSIRHNVIVVLFIDEFHRIAMVSPSAVEALKPILEKSAHNGFRIVAATTFEEYEQWIATNRALDQRLLRITLPELGRQAVVNILRSRAAQYDVLELADDKIFDEIYHQSKHILISNSQPRASIDMLLNMIGNATKSEHMENGRLVREYATPEDLGIPGDKIIGRPLLNRVIQRSYGIDIDNQISVKSVRNVLESSIFNQSQAVTSVMKLLELMLAGINDPTRPKISFLSTGPTGVGKALDDDTLIPILRHGQPLIVRHGDIQIGDYVFNRKGKPVEVIGVFPQGMRPVFEIELSDGRVTRCDGSHLWSVQPFAKTATEFKAFSPEIMTTSDLMNELTHKSFVLPRQHALEYPDFPSTENYYQLGVELMDLDTFPMRYLQLPVRDRLHIVQGLFDTIARVDVAGIISFEVPDESFKTGIQRLLRSLGVNSSSIKHRLKNVYIVYVSTDFETRLSLVRDEVLYRQVEQYGSRKSPYRYDQIKIAAIRELDEEASMTCIMVDDDEHLYQTLDGVVTHNTEVAKQASEALGIPLKRFDMSRYSRPEDAVAFADDLAHAAWSAPNAYILIDEVEKSTREAINILLQVLDDARLTASNNQNRVISFTGCIINLTTNLGSEVYQHMKRFNQEDQPVDVELIYRSLADDERFETAVLGRLDAIVPFIGLPISAMEKIARRELERSIAVVETNRRRILVSPDIIPYIAIDRTSTDSERGGARDIKRNIKNLVMGTIASYLANEPAERPIILYLEGEPRFKYEDIGNPLNAEIALTECHTQEVVGAWLEAIGKKMNTVYYDEGLFIPLDWTINDLAAAIVPLSKAGVRRFETQIDGETIHIAQSARKG